MRNRATGERTDFTEGDPWKEQRDFFKRALLILLAGVLLSVSYMERVALAQMGSAVLGAIASNPVATRESDGSSFIDVRELEGQSNKRPVFCDLTADLDMASATTTEIVALSGSTHIYVCSFAIHVGAAADVKFVSGTGTNCATSQADAPGSPNFDFIFNDAGINRGGSGGSFVVRTNDAGDALCVTTSTAADVDVSISYAQF